MNLLDLRSILEFVLLDGDWLVYLLEYVISKPHFYALIMIYLR